MKIICCENKESADFLKCIVNGLGEFLSRARLAVIPKSFLSPVISAWIPPPVLSTERIFGLLAKQNEGDG